MKTITKIIDINAHIANITCEIDVSNDMPKALISFDNLGFGVVTAVKFNAKGYNSFEDVVPVDGKDKFYLIIQDINIEKNTSAKNLKATLPNEDIRRLELEECQICYADGFVSNYAGADSKKIATKQFGTFGIEKEILEAIQDIISPEATIIPKDIGTGWLCSCERYNDQDIYICSKCGAKKEDIFKITNSEFVADIRARHKRNEEERKEKTQQEEVAKKRTLKRRNIKIGTGVIAGTLLIIFIGSSVVMSGRTTKSSGDYNNFFYEKDPPSDSLFSPDYNYESGYLVLEITVDSVTRDFGYMECKGSVENTGSRTYEFVKIKGAFVDSDGNVIDTDWTYAVGSEGLAPGEKKTFELSVPENPEIDSCSVSLLNFD